MALTHREKLVQLLSGPTLVKAPGVYDGLSALLVEQAGFDCAFLSGGSGSPVSTTIACVPTASSLGLVSVAPWVSSAAPSSCWRRPS